MSRGVLDITIRVRVDHAATESQVRGAVLRAARGLRTPGYHVTGINWRKGRSAGERTGEADTRQALHDFVAVLDVAVIRFAYE